MKRDILIDFLQDGPVSLPKLLFTHYRSLNINETEVMLLIHLHIFIESGNSFPTPGELSERMSVSAEESASLLRKLMQRGLLAIHESKDDLNVRFETYSLRPLWEQLVYQLETADAQAAEKDRAEKTINLYTLFEKEFGRPLSPIECETLNMWVDQDGHDTILIKAALREAVVSGKLNFRYIDRILFEWQKNRIHTVEQARSYSQKFRRGTNKREAGEPVNSDGKREVTFYNWLEQ
ncbi:DnaD domain-containing protein [Bacillus marinisedimentorum]|uniref:DnaD domain-containing protein n=1 Tax=Bacillus marinisedimentorum TaxID=1821260 RepID=UPI0008732D07|nr:DnaD domain-containing protein [Bacillus marinisedimentorum]